MDYLKYFENKVQEKLSSDENFAKAHETVEECQQIRQDFKDNYGSIFGGYGYDIEKMSLKDAAYVLSGTMQSLDEWRDDEKYIL